MSDDQFADLGLHSSFCRTVAKMGFKQPTEVQAAAIPEILDGKDLLAIAQTGTGKTAAFGLPLLQHLTAIKKGRAMPRCPRSLILAPTRELALQIHEDLSKLCTGSNLYLACVIGGVNQNPQVKKLRAGVDVL
ncbi:MAG: DEAD/DEAH box helicase, partial [Pseudomonadota bacterium]|nr:DEAD/DEAH box helicase [Pseudomonadota bacterium]